MKNIGLSFGPPPDWCGALRESLTGMAEKLQKNARPWQGGGRVFYPEDYGCRAGEMATEAIQRALDAAGKSGGTVWLRKGDYVSGTERGCWSAPTCGIIPKCVPVALPCRIPAWACINP